MGVDYSSDVKFITTRERPHFLGILFLSRQCAMLSAQSIIFVTFQITGTAEYHNDEIQNDEFVRMTFSYNMIRKQVTVIAAENIQNSAACNTDDATHDGGITTIAI